MVRKLIFLSVLLVSCAYESGQGGVPSRSGLEVVQAATTLQAATAISAQETRQSEIQATSTAVIAQSTTAAILATSQAQSSLATDIHLSSEATGQAIGMVSTSQVQNAAVSGTATAIHLLSQTERQIAEIELENLRIRNQEQLSRIKTREWLTIAFVLAVLLILAAALARWTAVTWRNVNPKQSGQQILVFGPDRNWQAVKPYVLPKPEERPLLPAIIEQEPTSGRLIELPTHLPKDRIGIGITSGNRGLWYSQSELGDIMGAGSKGSGKSSLVRSIAYQAYKHNWKLYLADAEQLTFDPAVWGNVASTVPEVEGMLNNLITEFDRRYELYRTAFSMVRETNNQYFVESLTDYNRAADRFNLEKLPPILLAWDEANNHLSASSSLDGALHEVLRRNRKPGCTVALFAHTWHSTQVKSAIFTNLTRRIALKCEERTSRVVLHSPIASTIPDLPGAAIMSENGEQIKIQSYYLPVNRILEDIRPIDGEWEAVESSNGRKQELEPGDRERIIELYGDGWRVTNIAEKIFGYRGGTGFYQTRDVVEDYEADKVAF